MFAQWHRIAVAVLVVLAGTSVAQADDGLRAGFAETDITPEVGAHSEVWLAGYAPGRKATGVHDPLKARCVVLESDQRKIALVSVDLVGLQFPTVARIRDQLKDFEHLTVSSTHNHEGPDVIGIWGESVFQRGVDEQYLQTVIEKVVEAIHEAERVLKPVRCEFGTAEDESLVNDSRLPIVKDGVLRAIKFIDQEQHVAGIIVQWSCHPESMGSRNRLVTADFPAWTVKALHEKHQCPVVYFTGAVGGLMAPPREGIVDEQGVALREGDFQFTETYGRRVAELADKALAAATPIRLSPFAVSTAAICIPVDNPWYRAARAAGVVKRVGCVWTGDPYRAGDDVRLWNAGKPTAVRTEVAVIRLGELYIAGIPGEIYPELVYGKVVETVEEGADFPDAPREPAWIDLVPSPKWILLGLANDEIGYIIPRRQWDRAAPFAYGRSQPQYGEINSCGPEVAPIIMRVLADLVQALEGKEPAN